MRHTISTMIVRLGMIAGSRALRMIGHAIDDKTCGPRGHYRFNH